MGAYARLYLDQLDFGSTYKAQDWRLVELFDPRDRHVIPFDSKLVPDVLTYWKDEYSSVDLPDICFYQTDAEIVRDRLNLIGITFEIAAECFRSALIRRMLELEEEKSKVTFELYEQEHEQLKSLKFESWLDALNLAHRSSSFAIYPIADSKSLLEFVLTSAWGGYPGHDPRVALRILLEACPEANSLIYDFTELVVGEYDAAEREEVDERETALAEQQIGEPVVVICEGTSDCQILRESLSLLFPHLASHFRFMDFDAFRVRGGAEFLASIVKAFAGAGISNRTIAIFDNDTAAANALKQLSAVQLPSNFRVRQLPPQEHLLSYPCIGPNGLGTSNINGSAASIELYFGDDVLTDATGNRMPIQWSNFDANIGRFHGAVIDKHLLQTRFIEKLAAGKLVPPTKLDPYWKPMCDVLNVLFTAFHDADGISIRKMDELDFGL